MARYKNIIPENCGKVPTLLLIYAWDTKYKRRALLGFYKRNQGWDPCYPDLDYRLTEDQMTEIVDLIQEFDPDRFEPKGFAF